MNLKVSLTNIFLQGIIVILSAFDLLTQFNSHRLPTKLFMAIICLCSAIALGVNLYHYVKTDKD